MLISGEASLLEVCTARLYSSFIYIMPFIFRKAISLSLFSPPFSQRVDLSLKTSMPWLVLAGSGGLADFLSDVLDNLSSAPVVQSSGEGDAEAGPSVDLKDKVAERVKKHFPSEAESDKLVERVSAAAALTRTTGRRRLLSSYGAT